MAFSQKNWTQIVIIAKKSYNNIKLGGKDLLP